MGSMGKAGDTFGFSTVDERGRVSALKALRACDVLPGDLVCVSVEGKRVIIVKAKKPEEK